MADRRTRRLDGTVDAGRTRMAESSKQAWEDVGERFASFGRLVAEHYKQRGEERGAPTAEEDRRRLEEAVATITRQLDQAFSSLGDTLRDPEAKDDLKTAARAVGDALAITFTEVGAEVRKRVGPSAKGATDEEGPGGDEPEA
jgi:hypothetical protein